MAIAATNQSLWQRFCRALDLEALENDSRFIDNQNRVLNRAALQQVLEQRFETLTASDITERLVGAGVPCGPVNDVGAALRDPQVAASGLLLEVQHPSAGPMTMIGPPYQVGAEPSAPPSPPPRLGEHTDEVLLSLGYAADDIDGLRARGVV